MPKLLVQRTPAAKRKRKAPPCGRTVDFKEPHSPFQLLVERGRLEKGYSSHELARLIGVPQSNLYLWLHNKSGAPHPRSFKPSHLKALANHLSLKEADLRDAYDASRHVFTPKADPMPQGVVDAFAMYIDLLARDPRKILTRAYALNLAKQLYNGATAARESHS